MVILCLDLLTNTVVNILTLLSDVSRGNLLFGQSILKWLSLSSLLKLNLRPSHTRVRLRTILKSDPILPILKSELDVLILKKDKFATHHYDSSEPILLLIEKCVNDLSCDGRTNIVRWLYDDLTMIASQKHWLAKNRHRFANWIANQYRLCLVGCDFVFGLKIGSDDRTIGEKIGSYLPILKSCDSWALVWLGHIRS